MNSTTSAEQINRHAVAGAAILQAYEQIGRPDQPLQRVDEQAFKLDQDAKRHPSDQQKRPAVAGRRPRHGTPLWGGIGLLLAACVFAWYSFGDAAKLIISRWVSEGISVSSLLLAKPEPPAEPLTVGEVVADAALPQSAPLAQTKPQAAPPKAAPASPDFAQLLQTIMRDIANLGQGIEQLKISQEQFARDNAKAIDQLKASQEQVARDHTKAIEQLKATQEQVARDNAKATEQLKTSQEQIARDNAKVGEQLKGSQEQIARVLARASEQNIRPKTPAPPPRATATSTHRRVPTAPSQAGAQPQAPKLEQQ
jgi:predicted FMN-binding regulatory protein PaiB